MSKIFILIVFMTGQTTIYPVLRVFHDPALCVTIAYRLMVDNRQLHAACYTFGNGKGIGHA